MNYGAQITRRSKRTLQKSVVDHTVAERLKWAKFGQEKGKPDGPDRATTTVGENVALKISAGNKVRQLCFCGRILTRLSSTAPSPKRRRKRAPRASLLKLVQARSSVGFARASISLPNAPTKRHLRAWRVSSDAIAKLQSDLELIHNADAGAADDDAPTEAPAPSGLGAGAASGSGKYIPVWARPGARPSATTSGPGGRDELPTLRVTNLSEDTQENDLRELFGIFGRVARVFVGRDRETGAGKGFAFVSFEERAVAQKAMEKVNGKGYDNLILSVQWSRAFLLEYSTHAPITDYWLRTEAGSEMRDGLFHSCTGAAMPIFLLSLSIARLLEL